jgi:type I restriction enzyme R subunit
VVDVLRKGIKHVRRLWISSTARPPGQCQGSRRFTANLFSVTQQLRYSKDETQLALDLALFINGLPVATFELKSRLTKQTVEDAVQQYKRDRDPRELLSSWPLLVHCAVDDQEVRFCTHLQGKDSWFLPFNKGYTTAPATHPPHGLRTITVARGPHRAGLTISSRTTPRW